jgi:DNA-binding transcriptional ArsR family regulator
MTVVGKIAVGSMPFLELRATLDRALDQDNEVDLANLLDGLSDRTGALIAGRDRRQIVELRGDLARLRHHLARRNEASALATVHVLHSLSLSLDSGANVALMHDHAERRASARQVLRERALDALTAAATPMRPYELASLLDSGPSQISRVLRALQADGLVQKIEQTSGDGRAVLYAPAQRAAA